MQIRKGKAVCGGIAWGNIFYLKRGDQQVPRRGVDDTEAEYNRVTKATEQALAELGALYQKALPEVGEQGAMVFEIHQMMLEDQDFCESIRNIINTQQVNAEYAVAVTGDNFAKMFSDMDDPYMRERSADVKDITMRLINCLTGESAVTDLTEPAIIAADDLSPSETVQLDKNKVLAFITANGSANSHTAILARTMGIPAIIGLGGGLTEDHNGMYAIVDGFTGELYLEPDAAVTAAMAEKKQKDDEYHLLLAQYKGKRTITLDGKEILVCANIGNPSELDLVLKNDSGGIGLFRSEFLYLKSNDFPTEEHQFEAYKTVAQAMAGKRVIFRTLDIGADKQIEYFHLPKEENPALGLRGVRICLERPDLFQTQIRALLRASAFGRTAIMFPMIASVWELREAKAAVEAAKKELSEQNIDYDREIEIGIMIETPAAALISDLLAPEVNFFSIGTNDLTQYTLAVDRQNNRLERYCDTRHEAILRLIKLVTENAHANGIWVGICGELAADLSLTKTLLEIGIDELSVSPAATLGLRRTICETRLSS